MIWSIVHGWVMWRLAGQISGLANKFQTNEMEIDEFLKQSVSAMFKLN